MDVQALDTVVPFYAVLLASASAMSLLAHFHHDVHHGVLGDGRRAHGGVDSVPAQRIRGEAKF